MKDSVRRALVAGLLGISCAREQKQQDTGAVSSSFQALTATGTRVFAFEGTIGGASSDWVTTSGTISASTSIKSEGTKSLSIIGSSNPTLTSIAIGPLGSIASPATLDVRLPSNLAGLSWQGQVALSFNSVTSGIYDQRSDWAPFNNLPTGTFQRISISIPAALVSVLSSSTASDLKVGIILQLSSNTQAAYLDRLTFAAGGASGSGGAGSGGSAGKGGTGGVAGKGGTGTGGKATGGTGTGGAPVCSPADCNDNNVCTTDVCSSGACLHNPVATGTACPDSTVCNGAETCNASGTCVAGTPPVVNDGNPCTTDSCNAATGVAHTPVAAGTGCPDSTVCNGAETCNASGTCVAGTPPVVNDGNPCTADSCNAVTGVQHAAVAVGTACTDGNACNGTETCNASSVCIAGTPPAIDDGNPCTADSCAPATGVIHAPLAVGTPCADANICNGIEACNGSGSCLAGVPPGIDDGNPCTTDTCDPVVGIAHSIAAAGTSCADANVCNGSEVCDASGACLPGAALAIDDGNACTIDICDPSTGVNHSPVAIGTSCSDGNACNGVEVCSVGGACVGGAAPALDDGNQCTTDTCNSMTGVQHALVPVGTPCSGGVCSATGACGSGSVATEEISVSVTLPRSVDPRRVGIGVMGDVYLADRSHLVGTSRTWMPMVVNTGSKRTEIGAHASCGSIAAFDRVFLRDSCIVTGNVTSKSEIEQQAGVYVAGMVTPNVSMPAGTIDTEKFGWKVTLPIAGTEPVMLEPDETRSLAGGSYGDVFVKAGATLDLAGSRSYRFNSLMVSPGGMLKVADTLPTELYVNNSVTYRGSIVTPTATRPPLLTLVILGTGQMSFETKIRSLMIAPKGKVVLGDIDRDYYGAVFADSVELRPDVTLHHIETHLPGLTPTSTPGGGTEDPELPEVAKPLVSAASLCGPREQLTFSSWPMPGFCPAQLGLSPFVGPRTGERRWATSVYSTVLGQPVTGSNATIHLVTAKSKLTTLTADGRRLWVTPLSGEPSAPATVQKNGNILVPMKDGSLRALRRDGSTNWVTSPCAAGAVTGVNVDDSEGGMVMGCADGSVTRRSALGTFTWSVPVDGPVRFVPTTGKPGIILAVTDSSIVRLAVSDGAQLWSQPLSAAPVAPALLLRDTAFVVSSDGMLHAYSVNGVARWHQTLGGTPSGALAITPYGELLVPTQSGTVIPVVAETGMIRTSVAIAASPVTQILVSGDGIAYAQSSDNQVTSFMPRSGHVLWTHTLEAAPAGLALSDEGYILASSTNGQVVALGSIPYWPSGGAAGSGSGLSTAECLAQMVETGEPTCNPDGTGTGGNRVSHTEIGNGTGGGGSTTPPLGHAACIANSSPPAGVTSQGLPGFGYIADEANKRGQLTWWTPAEPVADECRIQFCEQHTDADGNVTEVPIDLSQDRVNDPPPDPTSKCQRVETSAACPVDPESNTHAPCETDTDCTGDLICAVFCNDVACQSPEVACGSRLNCSTASLSEAPTGPFDANDENTWPCEDLVECAETGATFGVSGDPELRKTGSLEQRNLPKASFDKRPLQVVPAGYPNYSESLASDPCAPGSVGNTSNTQLDSRSGSSGNEKWGLYVEPDLSQKYNVELSDVFGLPNIDIQAIGSFVAGAKVWGIDLQIINARAEAILSTCSGKLAPSLKVFGKDFKEWGSYGESDYAAAPEPPTQSETRDCENALTTLGDKLSNLRKALLDARVVWDAYRRNGNVMPADVCSRTRLLLGNAAPAGCSIEIARAWISRYQSAANDAVGFVEGEYRSALARIAQKTEGAVSFDPLSGGSIGGLGASTSFPIGPVTVTIEVEVVGRLSTTGRLVYSMGSLDGGPQGGPSVRAEIAPGANADASVFVGAGIPGVSIGVEGEIRLIGVSAPIYTGITLSRVAQADPRPYASSGIFNAVSDGPSLLDGTGGLQKWGANWSYGAGVRLDTLSGKINLAARIRLWLYSKTFRKQIASWKGITKTYEFVGNVGAPLAGSVGSDLMLPSLPFPDGTGDLEKAFEPTGIGLDLAAGTLGSPSDPGVCSCANPTEPCLSPTDCCKEPGVQFECRLPTVSEGGGTVKKCFSYTVLQ